MIRSDLFQVPLPYLDITYFKNSSISHQWRSMANQALNSILKLTPATKTSNKSLFSQSLLIPESLSLRSYQKLYNLTISFDNHLSIFFIFIFELSNLHSSTHSQFVITGHNNTKYPTNQLIIFYFSILILIENVNKKDLTFINI